MNRYIELLNQYDTLIHSISWADGSRDALVREMDSLWKQLNPKEREIALSHADGLYQKRIA